MITFFYPHDSGKLHMGWCNVETAQLQLPISGRWAHRCEVYEQVWGRSCSKAAGSVLWFVRGNMPPLTRRQYLGSSLSEDRANDLGEIKRTSMNMWYYMCGLSGQTVVSNVIQRGFCACCLILLFLLLCGMCLFLVFLLLCLFCFANFVEG